MLLFDHLTNNFESFNKCGFIENSLCYKVRVLQVNGSAPAFLNYSIDSIYLPFRNVILSFDSLSSVNAILIFESASLSYPWLVVVLLNNKVQLLQESLQRIRLASTSYSSAVKEVFPCGFEIRFEGFRDGILKTPAVAIAIE
ncbi:hypothetical protein HHK36_000555 [Tetracentron sinense]|uniref:Uncharacterized protein n=1 Tax=Tetracentron sinense TaxID=13715 RepID=A0A834ZSD9_TETSI|nr:hypothetical protein HHK36_000555 [Tetracentron sinense]